MPWIDYDHDEPEYHYVGAAAAYTVLVVIAVLSGVFCYMLWQITN